VSRWCNPLHGRDGSEAPMHTLAHRLQGLEAIGRPRCMNAKLAIDVSERDLQAIAERGYEGAASTDHDQQAQAVGLFLTDALVQI
jgi:hypothetical protein